MRLAQQALSGLKRRVHKALDRLGDSRLVRGRIDSSRVKTVSSTQRKADREGWSILEAFKLASDIAGLRVVCNNLQDVYRVADLLENDFGESGIVVSRQDHIKEPLRGGYRAIHLDVRYEVKDGPDSADIGCEIQIRTLLQSAWGELSHEDIYKSELPASDTQARLMEELSKLMSAADGIADLIRGELAKTTPASAPAEAEAIRDSMAFIYQVVAGKPPSEYVLSALQTEFAKTSLRFDALATRLQDDALRQQVVRAYSAIAGQEPEPDRVISWMANGLLSDFPDEAVFLAESEARTMQVAARKPPLSGSWRKAIDGLTDSQVRWLANGWDALRECALCGEVLLEPNVFASAFVDHMKTDETEINEAHEAAMAVAIDYGIEIDREGPYCSYHRRTADKG